MNPFRLRIILILGIIIPSLSLAQNILEDLQPDIDLLGKDIDYLQERERYQEIDRESEHARELFPDRLDADLVERLRGAAEGEGEFVTVRIDGIPVALGDVPGSSWFAPFVRNMAERGIISGYANQEGQPLGLYGPADNVTIEQLAKIAAEVAGVPVSSCEGMLKNASARGRWSAGYIQCAEDLGWAVFSDGSVDVERPASRTEVVVTILQALGATFVEKTGTVFRDVTTATEFAVAIETAAKRGIVSGYLDERGNPTGMFGPLDPVRRAEIAKITSLALQVYGS